MSAEVLRQAASLMRNNAMAACPDGVWYDAHDLREALTPLVDSVDDPAADAEHIASWHPAVALAVASWLSNAADDSTYERARGDKTPTNDALDVARAYLGESA